MEVPIKGQIKLNTKEKELENAGVSRNKKYQENENEQWDLTWFDNCLILQTVQQKDFIMKQIGDIIRTLLANAH